MRVLVADDALFMRAMYKKIFDRNAIELAGEAANGFEAIAAYQECKPDLVIMDITMPGMTGMDALAEIIKIDPKAKVIMSSAMGQEEFVRRSIAKGAKAFVVKPVVESILLSTLERVMNAK